MTKEALKLALEALEVANSCVDGYYIPKGKAHLPEIELAITAIKEALAQPEQEPVAWVCHGTHGHHDIDFLEEDVDSLSVGTQLYTTPPQRKPLTDEEINKIWVPHTFIQATDRRQQAFARAIEAAHGIKGEA
jgi:hypothetical protein